MVQYTVWKKIHMVELNLTRKNAKDLHDLFCAASAGVNLTTEQKKIATHHYNLMHDLWFEDECK